MARPNKNHDKDQGKSGQQVYAEWFRNLTKDEQAKYPPPELEDGKIDNNYIFEVQPAHHAYAYTESFDFDEPVQKEVRHFDQDDVETIIRRVVMAMQLSEHPEVLFQARCILIAFGIGDPPTETELARLKGCSRQFVSKKVKRIQQLFNLSPSQYMRSEAACRAYADAWRKVHNAPEEPEEDDDTKDEEEDGSQNNTTSPQC